MLYYFKLRYRLAQRAIKEVGINPIFAYIILLIIFIGGSVALFNNIPYATWIYVAFGLYMVYTLSNSAKNEFLTTCFSKSDYTKIRIFENLIMITPFICFLLYKLLFIYIAISLSISILLVFVRFKSRQPFTIATPFSKRPFEFCVGFRKTFIAIIIIYILAVIAIFVDNPNLGFVSLILLFCILFTYYTRRERLYYIWSFSMTPNRFLTTKILTALRYTTLLAIPILLTLSIDILSNPELTILIIVLGYIYIATIILAKYSYLTEDESGASLLVVYIMIFVFTPLVAAPLFYLQSIRNLNKTNGVR